MKITVIGCGRWGSFIGWYLDKQGHDITFYGPATAPHMIQYQKTRTNGIVTLNEGIKLSTEIKDVQGAEIIVISINSQGLQGLMNELKPLDLKNKIFVLCMKGIEVETGRRLSQITSDNTDSSNKVAVWLGPGHVQEFCRNIPNCMVIDSEDEKTKEFLVDKFSSNLVRFYYGQDLLGNEIGAASKNVIGLAAGMLDGLDLSTLKGALMSRGTREIARLISAMGGNELSAYGLCHLGDYEATVFSKFSHNRQYGEDFVQGKQFKDLAEGCSTVKAMMLLQDKYNIELPICSAVYKILYENQQAKNVLSELFSRKITNEI